ncbi:DNA/RNA endonuclease YhcR with UshA esterase domain [Pullulanibacillus pueri]|uniref:DUF5689 domain-containing protein n=1 Tax=Pullulanibacillus pueri TaxID=1437324 RepID=A0A8J3ELE9_9BACL|nr:DUF5689 domain-containing protein [Pullulanibacillus pueri]MBM7680767.1 DNA/RNA endonuclease YhcR with UshA esterase domain [Pullulanibacillus pueri]GGH78255.1 hypothetical protein GCM10007096_11400 [Pullulanibacillus pueri]
MKSSKWIKILLVAMLLIPLQSFFALEKPVVHAETANDPAPSIAHKGEYKGKILFDNTHGETAGAADWVIDGGFSDFANAIADEGYDVQELRKTSPITYDDLKAYKVFVLGEANIPFKASEQQALLDYVTNGGSIFFIGDHYNSDRNLNRWDAGEVYNGYRRGAWDDPTKGMSSDEAQSSAMQGVTSSDWLSDNFGLKFRSNALGDITGGETVVSPEDSFGITEGVTTVEMHAGSTLAITNPDIAKGLIYMPKNPPAWGSAVDEGVYDGGGIDEGAFAAISKVGKGKAAFIGDSSPVEDPTTKYLREDNGGTKTTYDGFLGEGQDAVFLTNTVKWLADQEDYTSFDGKVTLSEKTPLKDFESNPALSTEPEKEPWSNPPSGYKWWDPTTFAPGSYGSSSEAAPQPTYDFVHQKVLPNNGSEFQIRLELKGLNPKQTVSNLKVGLYLTQGGAQIGQFEGATAPGYSGEFSVTADSNGYAYKDLNVKVKPGSTGAARLRVKQAGDNAFTEDVTLGDVDPEPLPDSGPTLPDLSPIGQARSQSDGQLVTVEGVVTSNIGTWGGKGFYLQDDTGGIYVFENTDSQLKLGDKVKLTAEKTTYNDEVELSNIIKVTKEGTGELPEPKVATTVTKDNQGQLITLEKVKIKNLEQVDSNGTFEFDAKSGKQTTRVRVDSRTGINYNDWKKQYAKSAHVTITGIASNFKGTYQLKPRMEEDFTALPDHNPPGHDNNNIKNWLNYIGNKLLNLIISIFHY